MPEFLNQFSKSTIRIAKLFWSLIFTPGKTGKTSPYLVFAYCVIGSTILWTILALENTYRIESPVKFQCEDLPSGFVVLEELPKSGTMQVEGKGWAILKLKSKSTPILRINLSQVDNNGFIDFTKHLAAVNPVFDLGLKPLALIPSGVRLRTKEMASKTVPIRFVGNVQTKLPYELLQDPQISPDSIQISAQQSILDTLKSLPILALYLKNIGASQIIDGQIDTVFLKKWGIRSSVQKIKVSIETERFTSFQYTLPLVFRNTSKSACKPSITQIKLEVSIPMSSVSEWEANLPMLQAKAIVSDADIQNGLVNIQIDKLPNFVRKYSLKPDYVNLIINAL